MRSVDIKTFAFQIIQDYFAGREDVAAVYLFGSAVGAGFSESSDIDIGVLFQPGCAPDSEKLLQEQERLSELLQRDVDLVSLNQASPIFCYQVLKYGNVVINRNQRAAQEFFVRTLMEYFDLKMSRRIIERSLHTKIL